MSSTGVFTGLSQRAATAWDGYWNGSFGDDTAARGAYRSDEFAKPCRPTVANTACGDVQLAHGLYYDLSFKMPYAYQRVKYSLAASGLGLLAIPGVVFKTLKHIVAPGPEGAKEMLTRDVSDLTKAVTAAVGGLALAAARIVAVIAQDPFQYLEWQQNAALLKAECGNNRDYQQYGLLCFFSVDPQKSFFPFEEAGRLPGFVSSVEYGDLPVPGAIDALQNARTLIEHARPTTYCGVSFDWHDKGHVSFASSHGRAANIPPDRVTVNGQEGQWLFPDHCIVNTPGAELVDGFPGEERFAIRVKKGTQKETDDSFSAFGGNTKEVGPDGLLHSVYWTELAYHLQARGIKSIAVAGLAEDFCVQATALAAIVEAGLNVIIVRDATAGLGTRTTEELMAELNAAKEAKHLDVTIERKTTAEMLRTMPSYFI